ncbi:MAG TPA: hypothetical protein VF013_01480 [Candidatus Limnocylindria bacterium]
MRRARHGRVTDEGDTRTTGATCAGCGEPILRGQSVIRLEAGLLLEDARFDPLIMRPVVYLHAGGGYDVLYDVHDRWCATPEGFNAALVPLLVHGETSASGH